MAHESFEDGTVAELLNTYFVSVKVDREERPDVDEAYMTAVQIQSGHGGWPMSVFLTPEGLPILAGTYFPREDRGQFPGFISLLAGIAEAWRSRREELERAAKDFGAAISEALSSELAPTSGELGESTVIDAVEGILSGLDSTNGGFGYRPKFPPHSSLELLLGFADSGMGTDRLRERARAAADLTLDRMAFGGIHDHVGGGFHRYSTDESWRLPHFEKMLYDNALLLGLYGGAGRVRVGAGIVEWAVREMRSPEGRFYSALDADSEGEEGRFYVWSVDEIRTVLGTRAEAFLSHFQCTPEGNYEDEATRRRVGLNVLHAAGSTEEFAEELVALRAARERRARPGLDHKELASWNGLMVSGLCRAGVVGLAEECAEAWASLGELPHQVVEGKPSGLAFLDDLAHMAWGYVSLWQTTGKEACRARAESLMERMTAGFRDGEAGGFFSTGEGHETLFGRSKSFVDSPVPSGNSAAARCLVVLGRTDEAERTVMAGLGFLQRAPGSASALGVAALELLTRQPKVVAVAREAKPQLKKVTVELERREVQAGPDGWAETALVLRVPEGVHINTNAPPARWLTPTQVVVEPLKAEIGYPEGSADPYEGEVRIRLRLRAGAKPEEAEVRVRYQPCTESECLPPEEQALSIVVLASG
jgi:uncharacterized protein YyaL (SSP411 family)